MIKKKLNIVFYEIKINIFVVNIKCNNFKKYIIKLVVY